MLHVVDRPHVFLSCGQFSESERALGHQITALVEAEIPGVAAYYAQNTNSLDSLSRNVLRAIEDCVGFIAILHPRGSVSGMKATTVRGSVWVEQEIAIAAARAQRIGALPVAVFVHVDIEREGLRSFLHLNESFREDYEIVDRLRVMIRNREFNVLRPRTPPRDIRHRSSRLGFGKMLGNFEPPHVAVRMLASGDTRSDDAPISEEALVELRRFVRTMPGFERMQSIRQIDEILFAPDLADASQFYGAEKALLIQDWGDVVVRINTMGLLLKDLSIACAVAYEIATFVERSFRSNPSHEITVSYQSRLKSSNVSPLQSYPEFSVDEHNATNLEGDGFIDAFRVPILRIMLEVKQQVSAESVIRSLHAARQVVRAGAISN